MSAGFPYPIVPPLPEFEQRKVREDATGTTTGETGGTTTRTFTPEQQAAQAHQDSLLHAQTLVAEQEGAQHQREASERADLAQQQAAQAADVERQRNAAIEASQKSIDEYRERARATQQKLAATPAPKFFQSGETWHNALKGIGAALAGVGDALVTGAAIRAGHGPPSGDSVSQIIDRDLNAQRERITGLKDQVVMATTGLKDANEARQMMLSNIDLKAAAAYDRLAKFGAARLAALGQNAAQIEGNKTILALYGKRLENEQAAVAPLSLIVEQHHSAQQTANGKSEASATRRFPTAAGKQATEGQNKQADLSAGMLEELATIKELPRLTQDELAQVQNNQLRSNVADSATTPVGAGLAAVGRGVGLVPRTKYDGLSPNAQRSMNAWDSLVEQRARQLTGAGMPEQEAIREARTLGYSPGDSPEVMQQKIDRLRNAADRGIQLSGNAGAKVAPPAPTEPPPFRPGETSPPPAAVPHPAAPVAPGAQKIPDKVSGKAEAPTRHTGEQIKSIQALLRSADAKKPENRGKVRELIARLRDLQERDQ